MASIVFTGVFQAIDLLLIGGLLLLPAVRREGNRLFAVSRAFGTAALLVPLNHVSLPFLYFYVAGWIPWGGACPFVSDYHAFEYPASWVTWVQEELLRALIEHRYAELVESIVTPVAWRPDIPLTWLPVFVLGGASLVVNAFAAVFLESVERRYGLDRAPCVYRRWVARMTLFNLAWLGLPFLLLGLEVLLEAVRPVRKYLQYVEFFGIVFAGPLLVLIGGSSVAARTLAHRLPRSRRPGGPAGPLR